VPEEHKPTNYKYLSKRYIINKKNIIEPKEEQIRFILSALYLQQNKFAEAISQWQIYSENDDFANFSKSKASLIY
jgi:hypothetical protein